MEEGIQAYQLAGEVGTGKSVSWGGRYRHISQMGRKVQAYQSAWEEGTVALACWGGR